MGTSSRIFAKVQFSQGDYKRKKNKIFDLVVATDKQHPTFVRLANEIGFSPAKEIIKEIVYAFEDPDGNYIEQFQSSGFDARLWELCIYAYLHEENFEIPRLHNAPDYMCEKFGETVFIEAVTVNPSSKIDEAPPQTEEEARQRSLNYMPIKYGSALYSKLQKRYWKLPQVKEWPLILAIHDFHQVQSILWSHASLPLYLYGYSQTTSRGPNGELIITPQKVERHEYKGKVIPSGFFFLPEAENISAVLFSNSATISKFNRMGKLAGFGDPRVKMIRRGYIHDPNPDADMPLGFSVEVERSKYDEFWADGFSMYHNPVAVHPVNPRLFPSITHHYFRDGQIESHLTDIFIHSSVTIITLDE